ncbi:cadmium-translocating P-type ATPase [Halobacteriovorax vibrionivorans]|uniref:Cadmium-translocating P-type ATPase n=1 Tax=Halobacteriovorax vibrionivorans TaxID=2152716 RepID=A0ABY0IEY5_9BACT|nr:MULTISPECIES: heavy metal translocating P-type ATPase [Halobacteriovorax]RZF21512.1 cadmium-translocating P-type ATPase [Halobacteriovorax vibrionivorans]TGD48784.1 cadmium-translocating P-type ATPase [Halobacteriovorax sp. Y22]
MQSENVNQQDINIKISGMHCASCASSIEKEVAKIDGVKSSSVNYAVESGHFEFDNQETLKKIEDKIVDLGYSIQSDVEGEQQEDSKQTIEKDNFYKFLFGIILAISVFLFEMGPFKSWPNQKANWYIQLLLTLPVWAWIGLKFQRSLFQFLTSGRSNMNTLIGLGTSAAFLYSVFITVFTGYAREMGLTVRVYFEAVGFITSFVYLGQYFEERAKKKTKEALNDLFKLSAKKANVLRDDTFKEIDISEVVVGDIIRVRPGEKFAVDGVITKGSSSIDESMISGEPIPVSKTVDDEVFAGTINDDNVVEYKASKVGNDTFLSQIISFVEDAQSSKPEIQKYADRISSIFTPAVILISIITFISWYFLGGEPKWGNSISNFIAVLVIACPCALGLATPTAVVVSTGRASLKGLLIGGGEVIEKAVKIDTIIFDKTGTITFGKPSVIDEVYLDKSDRKELLTHLASIEQFSEHPLAKAVVNFAKESDIELFEPDSFEVIKGKGLIAEIDDIEYHIGNEALFDDARIKRDSNLVSNKVGSFVFVAKDKTHIATLIVGDEIKPSAKEAIDHFKNLGIETWMITGDNEQVAKSVSEEIGIDHYISKALPIAKAKQVEKLQSKGRKVAMIGDGINDAPALAKADLSMAMGTGTDVAISASDVTIVKGDIVKAVEFIELANGTMKIIKQNLFLSMIYNTLLIPVAAGVLVPFGGPAMPPVLASIAMGLSSISVVTNSLRIRKLI